MSICIHKSLIGTDLHLISDDGEFGWSRDVPPDSWLCGFSEDHHKSLDILSEAVSVNLKTSPSEAHTNMWSSLRPEGLLGVPWQWALKKGGFQAHIKQLLEQIDDLLERNHDSYYVKEFVTIRQFLQGMARCKADHKGILKILNDDRERDGSLRSFVPDSNGYLQQVRYSQTSSCSGRLTVVAGPSILTLRKDRRSLLRSSLPGGKLIQVDFVSLEPRVALSTAGRESSGDIYQMVRDDVLGGSVTREKAKIATISSLYGMSARKLSEMIGDGDISGSRAVLSKIREYFDIPRLEKSLREESRRVGKIKSHYGRLMDTEDISNHVLVNRFIQSTATDAALLGFSEMVEKISKLQIEAKPVFVIHDALILDVEDSSISNLESFLSKPLSLPKLSGTFPVSMEIIA